MGFMEIEDFTGQVCVAVRLPKQPELRGKVVGLSSREPRIYIVLLDELFYKNKAICVPDCYLATVESEGV